MSALPLDSMKPDQVRSFAEHQEPTSCLLKELRDMGGIEVMLLVAEPEFMPEEVSPGLSAGDAGGGAPRRPQNHGACRRDPVTRWTGLSQSDRSLQSPSLRDTNLASITRRAYWQSVLRQDRSLLPRLATPAANLIRGHHLQATVFGHITMDSSD